MNARKIAVVSTSRADYGLLYWLLRRIDADRSLKLQLIVCGSHLDNASGRTEDQIRRDGFAISGRARTMGDKDSPADLAVGAGNGMADFARIFDKLKPDLVVVLGDRYELLAACSAAVIMRIPIAHIHGGESTEGALDEQVRHAVTKLSHLHFTGAQAYRERILKMGENPRFIFNVGALGLEYIAHTTPLSRADLEKSLGFDLRRDFALVTYHPETIDAKPSLDGIEAITSALDALNVPALFTYANADAGGRAINAYIERYARAHPDRAHAVASLGQLRYLSLMRLCSAVVGNSSSGIIEAPSLKAPTINIGCRQDGRLRAPSVIDCAPRRDAVKAAWLRATSKSFLIKNCRGVSPYGRGNSSEKIVRILKTCDLKKAALKSLRWIDSDSF